MSVSSNEAHFPPGVEYPSRMISFPCTAQVIVPCTYQPSRINQQPTVPNGGNYFPFSQNGVRSEEVLDKHDDKLEVVVKNEPPESGTADKIIDSASCQSDSFKVEIGDTDSQFVPSTSPLNTISQCSADSSSMLYGGIERPKTEDALPDLPQCSGIISKDVPDQTTTSKKGSRGQAAHRAQLECNSCCKIYTSLSQLNNHMKTCKKHFQCLVCSEYFEKRETMLEHECNTHSSTTSESDSVPVKDNCDICMICNRCHFLHMYVTRHYTQHDPYSRPSNRLKRYSCSSCKCYFGKYDQLLSHLGKYHTGNNIHELIQISKEPSEHNVSHLPVGGDGPGMRASDAVVSMKRDEGPLTRADPHMEMYSKVTGCKESSPYNHGGDQHQGQNTSNYVVTGNTTKLKLIHDNDKEAETVDSNVVTYIPISTSDESHQPRSSTDVSHQPRSSTDVSHQPRSSTDVAHQPRSSTDVSDPPRSSTDVSHQPRSSTDVSHRSVSPSSLSHEFMSFRGLSHDTAASLDTSHDPVNVLEAPVASADKSRDAVASAIMSPETVASEDMSHDPVASADMSHDPVVSADMSHNPVASTDMSHDPVSSADMSHGPVASEDNSHDPVASEDNSHDPVAPTQMVAPVDMSHDPVAPAVTASKVTIHVPGDTCISQSVLPAPCVSYECGICGVCCTTPWNLKRHLTKHNPVGKVDTRKRFHCQMCDFYYTKFHNYQIHNFSHHMLKAKEQKVRGPINRISTTCRSPRKKKAIAVIHEDNYVESEGYNLRRHVNVENAAAVTSPDTNTHPRYHSKHECDDCSQRFLLLSTLSSHVKVHHRITKGGEEGEGFRCDLCQSYFTGQRDYTNHRYKCHNRSKKSKVADSRGNVEDRNAAPTKMPSDTRKAILATSVQIGRSPKKTGSQVNKKPGCEIVSNSSTSSSRQSPTMEYQSDVLPVSQIVNNISVSGLSGCADPVSTGIYPCHSNSSHSGGQADNVGDKTGGNNASQIRAVLKKEASVEEIDTSPPQNVTGELYLNVVKSESLQSNIEVDKRITGLRIIGEKVMKEERMDSREWTDSTVTDHLSSGKASRVSETGISCPEIKHEVNIATKDYEQTEERLHSKNNTNDQSSGQCDVIKKENMDTSEFDRVGNVCRRTVHGGNVFTLVEDNHLEKRMIIGCPYCPLVFHNPVEFGYHAACHMTNRDQFMS